MNFRVRSNIRERVTQIQANLSAFPEQIQSITQEVIDRAEPEVLDILGFTPPRPRRKIEWTSEKQRKAYFATNGFGKGIPYRRTGTTPRGWKLFGIRTSTGATLIVQNEWQAAKYVYGQFSRIQPQQRFHNITGWSASVTQRQRIIELLLDTYRDVIRTQGRQLLFN